MKYSSAQLKRMSRISLLGHYGTMIGAILIYTFISVGMVYLPNIIFPDSGNPIIQLFIQTVVSFIIALILTVFEAGLFYMALAISRRQTVRFTDLFFCFRQHPDKIIIIQLVLTGIKFLLQLPATIYLYSNQKILSATLSTPEELAALLDLEMMYVLLLLLGQLLHFFITLPFVQAIYLAVDHENISPMEALKDSMHLMKGNKGRYIYLTLSFLGYAVLVVLTFGLMYFWLVPYMLVTNACFYRNLTGELQ